MFHNPVEEKPELLCRLNITLDQYLDDNPPRDYKWSEKSSRAGYDGKDLTRVKAHEVLDMILDNIGIE